MLRMLAYRNVNPETNSCGSDSSSLRVYTVGVFLKVFSPSIEDAASPLLLLTRGRKEIFFDLT